MADVGHYAAAVDDVLSLSETKQYDTWYHISLCKRNFITFTGAACMQL